MNNPYSLFIDGFAKRMDMSLAEASGLIESLSTAKDYPDDHLDHMELLMAASINAQLRNIQHDAHFKKFKFLLRNNNAKAVNLAKLWVDNKFSFEEMLAGL